MKRFFPLLPTRLAFTLWFGLAMVSGCGPAQGTGGHGNHHDGGEGDAGVIVCTNPPKDSDGDGISDHDEGAEENPPRDTDGDGTPDYLDLDSDNDTIPDSVEGRNANPCTPPVDSDNDGKPDFRDLDSDSPTDSTIPDKEEAGADPTHPVDTNSDGRPDYMDPDNDGDGIADQFELTAQGQAVAATTRANAPDTDGDGIPDYLDTDSDNDTISDFQEGAVDTDGDGIPNYRDLDSDGDCIPDALEAGDANLNTPAVDTDGDGAPDFEDTDSDNDGLLDAKEDLNCNGVLDPCPMPCNGMACETDRLKADTDGDGVNDLVESLDCSVKTPAEQMQLNCLCDGAIATSSPLTHGDFVFVSDYQKTPSPTVETLNLSTDVEEADVVFDFDTTGSQTSSINAVKTSLQTIAATVKNKVNDIAFGVFEFRDFLDTPVVKYDYRLTTANTLNSPTVAAVQAALGNLAAGGGGDEPEAGWESLYTIAGGPPLTVSNWTSAINLATIPPNPPPAGESQGTIAGAGFRAGSIPIVVTVSDAGWHDAPGQSSTQIDPTTGLVDSHAGFFDYSSTYNGAPSRETTIHLLQKLGAHVVGVAASNATSATGDSTSRMTDTAYDTGATATPADFGAARPAGCSATQCCTGLNGVGVAADANGLCPLAFQYNDGDGSGIGSAVASGLVALANGLKFDIHVQAIDVDPMTVENFMLKLVPNVSGAGPAAMCVVIPAGNLQDNFTGPLATAGSDGTPDTFPGVTNGKQVCFDVIPKMNTTVMNTNMPQLFRARLQVKGVANGATVNLGTPRDVFFLVPPVIVNGPIG